MKKKKFKSKDVLLCRKLAKLVIEDRKFGEMMLKIFKLK